MNLLKRIRLVWSFVCSGREDSLQANKNHKIALMLLEVRKQKIEALETEMIYLKTENDRLFCDNSQVRAILYYGMGKK